MLFPIKCHPGLHAQVITLTIWVKHRGISHISHKTLQINASCSLQVITPPEKLRQPVPNRQFPFLLNSHLSADKVSLISPQTDHYRATQMSPV